MTNNGNKNSNNGNNNSNSGNKTDSTNSATKSRIVVAIVEMTLVIAKVVIIVATARRRGSMVQVRWNARAQNVTIVRSPIPLCTLSMWGLV